MLVLCVAAQFIGFAVMWWTPQPYESMKPQWRPVPKTVTRDLAEIARLLFPPTTQPVSTAPAAQTPLEDFFPTTNNTGPQLNIRKQWYAVYTMAIPVTQLASLIGVSSQAIIVFVTLLVMLVAQAPGVAQITRSLIWSVLLLFMFLPWQYFAHDFPIPGVIYSYSELLRLIGGSVVGVTITGDKVAPFETWMIYGRFIVWPALGLLALLITAERFRAGVMIAIGHPLQSILQPRGTSPQTSSIAKPRPVSPGNSMGNRI